MTKIFSMLFKINFEIFFGVSIFTFDLGPSETTFKSSNNSNLNEILGIVGIEQKVETTSKGSTNSVMYLLAGMGFPTAILFIYMFIKQQIITKNRFIWFFITFVTVMSEPLLLRPFFFIFIISGFSHFFYKVVKHKEN